MHEHFKVHVSKLHNIYWLYDSDLSVYKDRDENMSTTKYIFVLRDHRLQILMLLLLLVLLLTKPISNMLQLMHGKFCIYLFFTRGTNKLKMTLEVFYFFFGWCATDFVLMQFMGVVALFRCLFHLLVMI